MKAQNAKRPRLSVTVNSLMDDLGLDRDVPEDKAVYLAIRKDIARLASGHLDLTVTYKTHEKTDSVTLMKVEHHIHTSLIDTYPKLNRILISKLLMDICQTRSRNSSLSSSLSDADLTIQQYQTILDKYPHLTKKEICDKVMSGDIPRPLTRTEAKQQGVDIWGNELPAEVREQLLQKKGRNKGSSAKSRSKNSLRLISDDENEEEVEEDDEEMFEFAKKKRGRKTVIKSDEEEGSTALKDRKKLKTSPAKGSETTKTPRVSTPTPKASETVIGEANATPSPTPSDINTALTVEMSPSSNSSVSNLGVVEVTSSAATSPEVMRVHTQDGEATKPVHTNADLPVVRTRPLTVFISRVAKGNPMGDEEDQLPSRLLIPAIYTHNIVVFKRFLCDAGILMVSDPDDSSLEIMEYRPYHLRSENQSMRPVTCNSEYEEMIRLSTGRQDEVGRRKQDSIYLDVYSPVCL